MIHRLANSLAALIALSSIWRFDAVGKADGPKPPPTTAAPVSAPAMPPDLIERVRELTEVVLDHHIDPPARQQMILSGIKALYRAAGEPVPPDLGRRVSSVATPEQLAALLRESWPRTTDRPIDAAKLADALVEGLLAPVPGATELMTEKERKVAESFAGNRYVGIHVALGWLEDEKLPKFHDIFKGGPADRAGIKKGDLLEEVDGVGTRGTTLRDVVDRLRGDDGTDVTIKVRTPDESKSRTITLTRGQLPRPTILGPGKPVSEGGKLRLDGPDPIGFLKITDIAASTPHELRKLAQQLESEGARALVLDLRGLGGGRTDTVVHSAVLLADNLLESGSIGRVRSLQGETTYRADSDALFRGWPIAVLVDVNTSGTAEWVAAALQDNHRATIIGSPTLGAYQPFGGGVMAPGEDSDLPRPFEATVRTTIPIGDGRWAVSLVTGRLEHGDGRPMLDPDEALGALSRGVKRPKGGVQPDHKVPTNLAPAFARRGPTLNADPSARRIDRAYSTARPDETPDPAAKPDGTAQRPPVDPAVQAAVTILHQALEKR